MHILFFDTETTGLPKNWNAPAKDVHNWPRMLQLAFQVADPSGKLVAEYKELIVPDGWEVPTGEFWVKYGYSTEKCKENGVPVQDALLAFVDIIDRFDVQLLVAHNMAYDQNIVGAEMIRREMSIGRVIEKACTMKASVDMCKIPGKYGFKFPKLEELYQHLFGRSFSGAHDAGNDVTACRESFFELVKLGVMQIPVLKSAKL